MLLKIKITPYLLLILAALVATGAVYISAYISLHQPWLGIDLESAEHGLIVNSVNEQGPSANILHAGDIILEIAAGKGKQIRLQAQDIIEDPDVIPTFTERDVFRQRQSDIYRILSQPIVNLTLDNGTELQVQPESFRPLTAMPVAFWLLTFYSVTALIVGTAIWGVNPQSVPARYLLLSGVGVTFVLRLFVDLCENRLKSSFLSTILQVGNCNGA